MRSVCVCMVCVGVKADTRRMLLTWDHVQYLQHTIKIIDFGSSCDWSDPFKLGLGDATNDPMYAAPEQTLSLAGPGKFDVFSVGMTGVRVLLPSLTKSSPTKEWPGGRFQKFAEQEFPGAAHDFKLWLQQRAGDKSEPKLAAECEDMLSNPVHAQILALLQKMLSKSIITRPSVQSALEEVHTFPTP